MPDDIMPDDIMPDDIMPDDCNIIAIARSTNLVIELIN